MWNGKGKRLERVKRGIRGGQGWRECAGLGQMGIFLFSITVATGCQAPNDAALRQGFISLSNNDTTRALHFADAQLRETPTGREAAEAWYLRGRALEQWPARNETEQRANLANARAAYERALAFEPPMKLRAYARASLGNVAFFQEDFAKAAEMFTLAAGELDTPDAQAWAEYRAGLSLQRLGQFEQADGWFDGVAKRYPGTLQARRATENRGARAFHLRIGTYNSESAADRAADGLRREGFRGLSVTRDLRGMYILRVGPYATYSAARQAERQVAGRFPDAMVMP